jgi:hypothetical protein
MIGIALGHYQIIEKLGEAAWVSNLSLARKSHPSRNT